MADPVKAYGWTAMPRKVETLLASRTDVQAPAPVSVRDITLPNSPLAKAVLEHTKKELAPETFNHSMRVFYYGTYPTFPPLYPRTSTSTSTSTPYKIL
jgi:cyanamide hydratase